MQILFIVLVHFQPQHINIWSKSTAFQFVYWVALLSYLTGVVSQHCCWAHPVLRGPLQPLGRRALAKGQLLWCCILDYFTCCLLDSMEDSPSGCPVLQCQHKPLKKPKLLLDPDSWNSWPSFPKSQDWLRKLAIFFKWLHSLCIKFCFGELLGYSSCNFKFFFIIIGVRNVFFVIWKQENHLSLADKKSTKYCKIGLKTSDTWIVKSCLYCRFAGLFQQF